ncbi:M23 family metallopeptidase [Bacillus massilinigeriensis]|uniref:M23 family metallopeptidase n=1 Tax=Bacillus mediterraneensis TaxID=1805474 RepID=UPI0008F7FEF1|nr:M23 family metallopeptidase [Bacillus mediterraneensis]
MRDYIKRLLIAVLMGICVSLLFLGGKHPEASVSLEKDDQDHWVWPASGNVTDVYGTRGGKHKGVDIAGPLNDVIVAVESGTVTKSYYSASYGNVVFVKHPNGYETVYAHLKTRQVAEGQDIEQGDILGYMGNTGDSSGVHLHFEVHQGEWTWTKENAVDPVGMLGDIKVGQAVAAKSVGGNKAVETAGEMDAKKEDMYATATHIVKKGETLWSISQNYGISVEDLMSLNNLKGERITVGKALEITRKAAGEKQYRVSEGETLYSISKKLGITIEELQQRNRLSGNNIRANQILVIK